MKSNAGEESSRAGSWLRTALTGAVLAFAVAVPTSARAQQVPLRDLPKPSREIDDPFSMVTAAIEFKPGQLAVVDGLEPELALVNFADGSRTKIGRDGSGPGEFRIPGGLVRMPGDTLWVIDPLQMRIVAFGPDLKPGTTFPFQILDSKSMSTLSQPFRADARGNVYASAITMRMGQGGGAMNVEIPDSASIVRLNARDATARTELGKYRVATSGKPQVQQNGGAIKMSMAFPGLVASDAWTVFPDGRLALVHGSTYMVEFITADGRHSAPVRIAYDKFPVTSADKDAEMAEVKRQVAEQSKAMQKMMPPNVTMTIDITPPTQWPDAYPPISALGAIPAPDGRLWVKRSVPTRLGREQWDVIDPSGKLVARWRMPAKVQPAAVGQGVVYTVRTDEDDLRYVQRVELPK